MGDEGWPTVSLWTTLTYEQLKALRDNDALWEEERRRESQRLMTES